MIKKLKFLQKNLSYAIPIATILGVIYGGYLFDAQPLKQLIIPITFLMIFPMMATLDIKSTLKCKDIKLQATAILINFIFVPIVAYTIGTVFFSGGGQKFELWAVGLFLIGVLPASGMTISWTGFAKGNKEAATKMLLLGLAIGSLVAPIYTKVFMGASVDVNMLHMFKQICLFVFVPMITGIITQNYIIKKHGENSWNKTYKPNFPPFSSLGVIMIAFTAMALKSKSILAHPGDIIIIIVPLIIFYLVLYTTLSLIGKFFLQREDAIALIFGVVARNLSIALAIAITAFKEQGPVIALLISLAYIIQIQSAAWYVKFIPKIFGPIEKKY